MSRIVIDAAVGLKWVVAEAASRQASALREHELLAPESILLDWAEALAAKNDRGELSPEEARERLAALLQAPVALTPLRSLVTGAQALVRDLPISMRTATCLALAVAEGCVLVCADRELVARVKESPWRDHIALLGSELPHPADVV